MKITIIATTAAALLLGHAPVSADMGPSDRQEVRKLARKLEKRTRDAYRRADRRQEYGRRGDGRAVRALYDLRREASRFHDRVRRGRRATRAAARDFRALQVAFERAAYWVDRGHLDRRVRKDFRKVNRTFRELSHAVAPYRRWGIRGSRVGPGGGVGVWFRWDGSGRSDAAYEGPVRYEEGVRYKENGVGGTLEDWDGDEWGDNDWDDDEWEDDDWDDDDWDDDEGPRVRRRDEGRRSGAGVGAGPGRRDRER